ncbi:MAG: phosphoenolpyruvate synthase [Deltaproteobacteria bacterium]|nr:phosphoenolpyruvate synthase [Deltaproteobacteria bacterium]
MQEILGAGHVGGKANGFIRSRAILQSETIRTAFPELVQSVRFPETFFLTADHYDAYVERNRLAGVVAQCEAQRPGAEDACLEAFLAGTFPPETITALRVVLDRNNWPLAVRSSSLLEDRPKTSFAGKYLTLFISNRGDGSERLHQLTTAVQQVYASVGSANAIQYRRRHRLLKAGEKMAVMIQHAIGREFEGLYFPIIAGVGFSQNPNCWHPEIKKGDGLVRLVFGLGTRAVGRGYARIFSPGSPTSRAEGLDAETIDKFSQGWVDCLDLSSNEHRSIRFREIIRSGFDCPPSAERLVSLRDGTTIYVPATRMWNPAHRSILTFDAILGQTWAQVNFPLLMKQLLQVLEREFGYPVDTEFAGDIEAVPNGDIRRIYLLQGRALSQREEQYPRPMPKVPSAQVLFTARRSVPTGYVEGLEYIVYVDPEGFFTLPRERRHTVARYIGQINRALEGQRFLLIGPGRWGSVNIDLGVPCQYAEISNCAVLIEVAKGRYAPEASYGTHFFQDLIEDQILYLPLYPEDPGIIFREDLLLKSENHFARLCPEASDPQAAATIHAIHLPTATGKSAVAVLNGIEEKGIVVLDAKYKKTYI